MIETIFGIIIGVLLVVAMACSITLRRCEHSLPIKTKHVLSNIGQICTFLITPIAVVLIILILALGL